jgi:hypothetical protein
MCKVYIYSLDMTNTVCTTFQTQYIKQAIAEHWDLPNTEIFQSKDVASEPHILRRILENILRKVKLDLNF